MERGYASVTPLRLDLTNHGLLGDVPDAERAVDWDQDAGAAGSGVTTVEPTGAAATPAFYEPDDGAQASRS